LIRYNNTDCGIIKKGVKFLYFICVHNLK
jgi:hypothetical protein